MGMGNFAYLVGDLTAVAGAAAAGRARKRAPERDSTETVAPAGTPTGRDQRQRRRRTAAPMLGRGYEYMDLDDEGDLADQELVGTVAASGRGAGTQGFAGTAIKSDAGRAAGLTTLSDGAFGGGPRMPMIPGTWDSSAPPDPSGGSASHT